MFEEMPMLQIEFIDNQINGLYNIIYACTGACILALMLVGVTKLFPFNKKVVEEVYDPVIRIKNKK